MANQKFYEDIKSFPDQLITGLKIAEKLSIKDKNKYQKIIVCGMGGSSYFVEFIQDILNELGLGRYKIIANRDYRLPKAACNKILYVISSYSGNTEEVLSCLNEVKKKSFDYVIFASGGKLLEIAIKNKISHFKIPTGIQPRLSSGYYIAGILYLLSKTGIIQKDKFNLEETLYKITNKLQEYSFDDKAKEIVIKIKDKLPIIYTTAINSSIGRMGKIKINENSKTQCFYNFFPELNHNEMVGFTKLVTNPVFLIIKSKFANERNKKRIRIFSDIMEDKNLESIIIEPEGDNIIEELFFSYTLFDYISYYLAIEYGIDPEPVKMVEEFKKML